MMRMLAAALVIAAGPVCAETMLVAPSGSLCAGQSVKREQFFSFLSTTKACPLPIVHAKDMRAFTMKSPNSIEQRGCWGKTLGDDAVFVYEDGKTGTMPMGVYAKIEFEPDGSGKVVSSYNQDHGYIKCP